MTYDALIVGGGHNGLTCAFCYQIDWVFEKMAMDEPLGSGFLRSIELSPAFAASRT